MSQKSKPTTTKTSRRQPAKENEQPANTPPPEERTKKGKADSARGTVSRRVMGPAKKTSRTIPRVYCAFVRNIEEVVINDKTGTTTKRDNGGYRYGVKCDDREAIFYNKKATNIVEAIHYSRLKALECALDWFDDLQKVIICDEHGEAKTQNRSSLAPRYIWVMNKKATDSGVEVSREQINRQDNIAKNVAKLVNGPQYYTEAAKQALSQSEQQQGGVGRSDQKVSQGPTVIQRPEEFAMLLVESILAKAGIKMTEEQIREAAAEAIDKLKTAQPSHEEIDHDTDIPVLGDDADAETEGARGITA